MELSRKEIEVGGMSQSASVIESEDVEEESDEEDQEARDQPERSGQGKEGRKSRRKLKTKLENELSTITVLMEVKGQEMMRIRKHVNLAVQGGREIPRQDAVNESKIERTLQQYDCECERVLAWLRGRVKFN